MNKRVLWVLTISLSLAMAGLIVVQINWVRNALELNERQFIQLVNTTLSDISNELNRYYTAAGIENFILENENIENNNILGQVMDDLEEASISIDDNPEISGSKNQSQVAQIINDSIVLIRDQDDEIIDTMYLKQYYDLEIKRKAVENYREQKLILAAAIKKMLIEDVAFEDRVDQAALKKVLDANFTNRGVHLKYEFAVIRDNNKEIYKSEQFKKITEYYYFRSPLMSSGLQEKTTYLYIYFPGQQEVMSGSLGFLGISSLALSIVMILLFSFALYVIYRQKKLSDIKNDFVNNMTHELKTPISTISLASQMLNDKSIPLEKKNTGNISKIIQTESKRLGYQVERVLQMAVLDQGHLVVKKEKIALSNVVVNVVNNFKLQIEDKQGSIDLIDESLSDLILGDKVHLTNVITNLIDNAVKYSMDSPIIRIKLYNAGDWLVLSVRDNGIGISKENQKKVFEKFYRVSTGNLHDVKGFGLGLSYVKLIVEEHEGTIKLTSEFNKGTQFDVKFPYINN